MPPVRTPDEIRASIEQNRAELGASLEKLRGEVEQLTDWRSQLRRHQQPLMVTAAVAGFVLGGGIGGLVALVPGRGRRKRGKQPQKKQKKQKKQKS